MRLLEFDKDTSGANPRRPGQGLKTSTNSLKGKENAALPENSTRTASSAPATRPPVPLAPPPKALKQAARRKPIDLEQLQERVGFIERRLRQQARQTGTHASARDLEKLKLRMQLLERSLDHELGAARHREQQMLQALDKPTLKARLEQRLMRFWLHDLPLTGDWLREAAREWWRCSQPEWWPRFARAWQQALEQARR